MWIHASLYFTISITLTKDRLQHSIGNISCGMFDAKISFSWCHLTCHFFPFLLVLSKLGFPPFTAMLKSSSSSIYWSELEMVITCLLNTSMGCMFWVVKEWSCLWGISTADASQWYCLRGRPILGSKKVDSIGNHLLMVLSKPSLLFIQEVQKLYHNTLLEEGVCLSCPHFWGGHHQTQWQSW